MFRLPVCLERVELILQKKKMKFEETSMKTTILPEESDAKSPAGASLNFSFVNADARFRIVFPFGIGIAMGLPWNYVS